jgi:hypothetical protein
MPVSRPVNNAVSFELASANAVYCTLCGVLDAGNCGELLRFCYTGPFARARLDVDTPLVAAFSRYYELLERLPHDESQALPRQIAGIVAFLRSLRNVTLQYRVTQHGSTNAPLTLRDATTVMLGYPDHTRFVYMLGAWRADASAFVDAHWLLAVTTNDAITYTDHQLDLAEPVRAEVAARVHAEAPLDAPLVASVPTRPFGTPTQPSDRAVVLACVPAP